MDVLRALGVSVLVQKRTAKERPGLFVASSCGPKAYLGDGKILPEDHTELAVWRQATDTSCGDLLREQIYEHLALETFFDEKTVVAAGKEVQVYWFYAKPYWQWPVMYMLACKELGQSRFVLRFAVAGPGVDVGQLLQDMGRVYDSLQFPRGKP
ncbi:MAG: hypothetical protein KatS3mg077_2683 [Candidatus Binatia bacterium]|nr:MAG: hypothetical protein KatS3mg077_2683 [Candidatus Binatia bacterium]